MPRILVMWFQEMLGSVRRNWHVSVSVVVTLVALVTTAVWFPSSPSGGLALIALVAAAGVALSFLVSHARRWGVPVIPGVSASVRASVPALVCTTILLASGIALFWPHWVHGSGWVQHDWGSHHAVVRTLIDGLKEGHTPVWSHALSTGDAPYELYPSFVYYLIAALAILFDSQDLPLLLMRVGIATQVLFALASMRLASRVATWPLALAIGLVVLLDRGTATSGGALGLLRWGVLHAAVAQVFVVLVFTALLDALRRPSLGVSVQIWLFSALATATHPIAITAALGAAMALAVVFVLATDIPRYRSIAALCQVAIGAALAAFVWMPLAERLISHGLHYAAPPPSLWQYVSDTLAQGRPQTSFVVVVYIGYMGLVVGLLSRRAAPTLLAGLAAIFIAGVSDHIYTLLALDPSPRLARFPTVRLMSLGKPALYALAAYLVGIMLQHALAAWRGRSPWLLYVLIASSIGVVVRGVTPYLDGHILAMRNDLRDRVPDPQGFKKLLAWARSQVAAMRPDAYGRLLADEARNAHYVFHIQAETGLPGLYIGPQSDLLLRERIEDTSPESLRRFNVRWVVRYNQSPRFGDPATELVFGNWRVRTITNHDGTGWDGQFARIERGAGQAVVTQLDNERVVVELRGTDQPALVALGMGYYPRWRARNSDGRLLPVYAMLAVPGRNAYVAAAWLPPGRTEFTPDGPLPSDGKGLPITALALLLCLAIEVTWSRARWRGFMLRRLARVWQKARAWAHSPWLRTGSRMAIATIAIALLITAAARSNRPVHALRLGNEPGLTGNALVEARTPEGSWETCTYSIWRGGYSCRELLFVEDGQAGLVNDSPLDWPHLSPALKLWSYGQAVEFRITMTRKLVGSYLVASQGGVVQVAIDEQPIRHVGPQQEIAIEPGAATTIALTGTLGGDTRMLGFTLVRPSALDRPRQYPLPPAEPPAAVSGH